MYIHSPHPPRGVRAGFTLVELLVTISIIAIIAGISLPVFQRSMVNARRVKGVSNLRQAGVAIMTYANDHNAILPGPCPLGVVPTYSQNDKTSLGSFLAPYLGLADVSTLTGGSSSYRVISILQSPGIVAALPALALPASRIPHYIQSDVLRGGNASGSGTSTIRPFGASGDTPPTDPVRLTRLGDFSIGTSSVTRPQVWLLSDVDQQSTDSQAIASGWFTSLPLKPVYVTNRLRIYADGHAAAAGLDEP